MTYETMLEAFLPTMDWSVYLVYADLLLDQQEDDLAYAYRYMGTRRLTPLHRQFYHSHGSTTRVPAMYSWGWYSPSVPTLLQKRDEVEPYCILPRLVFFAMAPAGAHMRLYSSHELSVAGLSKALHKRKEFDYRKCA